MHLDPSLKRIPLLRQLASSFETLQSVDPVEALRRQLAVLEPTVRGLLNIHNPSVAIVREKLDAMEAIVASIPDDSAPGLAAEWRAKMTAWWLEFSNQQEAVLFSSSAAVVVEKAAARMPVAEKKKEEDESQLVQPSPSPSPPQPPTRPSAPYQEPVIFPKSSVEQSASLGQQFISLRDGSFCSASMTHFQLMKTPVEDGSTVEESSGESEPEGRRTSQELARRRVSTTADQEDHHQMKTAWSSANKSDACSTAAAASAADAELIYDAGESKMAGLMAIQFFSKGH